MTPELLELARLYKIQTSYLDMTKQRRDADPEALLLVLRAMGAGVEKFDDVPEALARRKDELRKRKVEPVIVAWDGKLGKRKFEIGYHQAEIKGQETFVISAPRRAFWPASRKTWGVFAPIYALHSKRNPAAGDLRDFEQLMDWINQTCLKLRIVPPVSKRLACGDVGVGAMAAVSEIVHAVAEMAKSPT